MNLHRVFFLSLMLFVVGCTLQVASGDNSNASQKIESEASDNEVVDEINVWNEINRTEL
jgi:hypothetical protein